MSSGLAFDENQTAPSSDILRMLFDTPDMAAFAASRTPALEPGTSWQYSSGTSMILSRVLREALGDDAYHEFPRRMLFEPLGMHRAVLEVDASGTFVASSYMYATAREWARFGQLYLQDGVWMGQRILPDGWVAFTRAAALADPHAAYGAHFWLTTPVEYRGPDAVVPDDVFHAAGHEAQFVTIVPSHAVFVRRSGGLDKGTLTATVRMETPVLYFYAAQDAVVRVSVRFRQGFITEYFPRATVGPARPVPTRLDAPGHTHSISWHGVRVQPDAPPDFPVETRANHYYAARETDAAPLLVGPDRERFLFYRGAGDFALPLVATVAASGEIEVANTGGEEIAAVLLFENRRGRIGWRLQRRLSGQVKLAPPRPDGDLASLRIEIERLLCDEGLYPKEAAAMVETWADTWFEEGARLFYLLPRRTVDSILPLEIRPAPADLVRVFVGRLELATPATLTEVRDALRANDRERLARFGRFLRPFADRILAEPLPAADRARFEAMIEAVDAATREAALRQE